MACLGTEESLYQCSSNGIGIHNCAHYEDAGVVCSSEQLFCYSVVINCTLAAVNVSILYN